MPSSASFHATMPLICHVSVKFLLTAASSGPVYGAAREWSVALKTRDTRAAIGKRTAAGSRDIEDSFCVSTTMTPLGSPASRDLVATRDAMFEVDMVVFGRIDSVLMQCEALPAR